MKPEIKSSGNAAATTSLVLVWLSLPFFVFFFVLLLTILFGWIGRRDARQGGAPYLGRANWGISLGLLGLALLGEIDRSH